MRGRLIQRFKVTIRRLDTVATESSPGYDDVFREVVRTDTDGDGLGEQGRVYHSDEELTCQMDPTTLDSLQAHSLGQDPDNDVMMLLHFRELEASGFVDSNGMATIKEGTRLVKVSDLSGNTVYQPPDTEQGGLEVTGVTPVGWGLNMVQPTRNLLEVRFARRRVT